MRSAKLFMNGQSQAVRLPKEFRFKGDEVFIKRIGKLVVLFPKDAAWDSMISSLKKFTPDFLEDRPIQLHQDRDDMFEA